jgi:hypothetical protein
VSGVKKKFGSGPGSYPSPVRIQVHSGRVGSVSGAKSCTRAGLYRERDQNWSRISLAAGLSRPGLYPEPCKLLPNKNPSENHKPAIACYMNAQRVVNRLI